jgi:hypothetical protein
VGDEGRQPHHDAGWARLARDLFVILHVGLDRLDPGGSPDLFQSLLLGQIRLDHHFVILAEPLGLDNGKGREPLRDLLLGQGLVAEHDHELEAMPKSRTRFRDGRDFPDLSEHLLGG